MTFLTPLYNFSTLVSNLSGFRKRLKNQVIEVLSGSWFVSENVVNLQFLCHAFIVIVVCITMI